MSADYRTLAEMAAALGVKPRWLRELVQERHIPVLRKGRVIRFDAIAIRAVEDSLRCRLKSSAEKTPVRSPSSGRSTGPMAPEAALDAALKATTAGSLAKKPRRSKRNFSATPGTGNVVAFEHSQRQS